LTGFFRRTLRKPEPAAPAPVQPARSPEVVATSKVFPRFLSAVAQQSAPVLLDLGPVVGSNITYFGERLACKIYVEDLVADVEAHAKRGERDRLAAFFATRLTQESESVDGILCWEIFDFIDPKAGKVLARQLTRLLKNGGSVYGFFGMTNSEVTVHNQYVIEAENRLRLRPYPASPVRRSVLAPRDMARMFDGLLVTESVLLKTNTRETLLKKG
jgi:hypothetical protein